MAFFNILIFSITHDKDKNNKTNDKIISNDQMMQIMASHNSLCLDLDMLLLLTPTGVTPAANHL